MIVVFIYHYHYQYHYHDYYHYHNHYHLSYTIFIITITNNIIIITITTNIIYHCHLSLSLPLSLSLSSSLSFFLLLLLLQVYLLHQVSSRQMRNTITLLLHLSAFLQLGPKWVNGCTSKLLYQVTNIPGIAYTLIAGRKCESMNDYAYKGNQSLYYKGNQTKQAKLPNTH